MDPHTAFGGELEAVPKQVVEHLQRVSSTWKHFLAKRTVFAESIPPPALSAHAQRLRNYVPHRVAVGQLSANVGSVHGWLAWAGLGLLDGCGRADHCRLGPARSALCAEPLRCRHPPAGGPDRGPGRDAPERWGGRRAACCSGAAGSPPPRGGPTGKFGQGFHPLVCVGSFSCSAQPGSPNLLCICAESTGRTLHPLLARISRCPVGIIMLIALGCWQDC